MHSGSDLQLCSGSVFATVFTGNSGIGVSELSFYRNFFPSFHPFPLSSAGWPGGKQCAALAVGPVDHSQYTSLFADDTWKTQRHSGLHHESGPDSTQSTCPDCCLRRCSLLRPLCSILFLLFPFLLSPVDQLCHEVKALWGFGMLLPRASSSTRRSASSRSFTEWTPTR